MNVDPRPLSVLSLCSGVGMLDLGLGAAFDARTVCYVEREAFAASQLVALMEAGILDAAPVWSDLATFDARPWRGRVDCIIAGLPCQPYSAAGKQEGNDDRRSWGSGDGPIPHFLRIVAECRPAVAFLENVTAWVVGGFFRPVGEELCRLGYDLERPLQLAASDVGASHQRERVFVMAYDHHAGRGIQRLGELLDGQRAAFGNDAHRRGAAMADHASGGLREFGRAARAGRGGHADGRDADVEDAARHGGDRPHGEGWRGRGGPLTGVESGVEGSGIVVALADGAGSQGGGRDDGEEGRQEPDGHAGLAGGSLFAPGPLDPRWSRIIADHPHLAPATEPGVRGLAHGFAWLVDESRRHQLRAIGNGAVPLCFAVAVTTLARRAVERRMKAAA